MEAKTVVKFSMELQEWDIVFRALSELPYRIVNPLMKKLTTQLEKAQEPPPPPPLSDLKLEHEDGITIIPSDTFQPILKPGSAAANGPLSHALGAKHA